MDRVNKKLLGIITTLSRQGWHTAPYKLYLQIINKITVFLFRYRNGDERNLDDEQIERLKEIEKLIPDDFLQERYDVGEIIEKNKTDITYCELDDDPTDFELDDY